MRGSTVNPAAETFGQARQGSVAAIIQVLNERLADVGIRTRAVVADGMLQLLCEAETSDKLEKAPTVERVRTELEDISPQRIKRVKINSRIVREAQLLWLEEINRDPENALLWSEVITLRQPFFIKRWIRDRHLKPAGPIFKDITAPEPSESSLPSKVIGGLSLVALLLGAGWLFREDLGVLQRTDNPNAIQPNPLADGSEAPAVNPSVAPTESDAAGNDAPADSEQANSAESSGGSEQTGGNRAADTTPPAAPSPESNGADSNTTGSNTTGSNTTGAAQPPSAAVASSDSANSTGNASDAFAEAVRVANQAAVDGQTASTAAEWLDLAARWQKASDLMGNIPVGNERYAIAQDRIAIYQTNSQSALQRATTLQESQTP